MLFKDFENARFEDHIFAPSPSYEDVQKSWVSENPSLLKAIKQVGGNLLHKDGKPFARIEIRSLFDYKDVISVNCGRNSSYFIGNIANIDLVDIGFNNASKAVEASTASIETKIIEFIVKRYEEERAEEVRSNEKNNRKIAFFNPLQEILGKEFQVKVYAWDWSIEISAGGGKTIYFRIPREESEWSLEEIIQESKLFNKYWKVKRGIYQGLIKSKEKEELLSLGESKRWY